MHRLILLSVVILKHIIVCECVLYDRYKGTVLNETEVRDFINRNLTKSCAIDVKPCSPREGRRADGTCTNIKAPSRGSAMGPYLRLLPAVYGANGTLRRSKSGKPLPSARAVRVSLQSTGQVVDRVKFTTAATHYAGFFTADITRLGGTTNHLTVKRSCCTKEGEDDKSCMPIQVPDNDPYLALTNIRCLNLTRADTFQDLGCLTTDSNPQQINTQTPSFDLSIIYGTTEEDLNRVRDEKDGLLKLEQRKGYLLPVLDRSNDACKNPRNNSVCYRFGSPQVGNIEFRMTTLAMFFMREHNRIAKVLKKLNPCWKNDRLFKVAQQINVATATNIYMYELLPLILGFKNLINFGLISQRVEFLKFQDRDLAPMVFAEYAIAARYFHTFVDGKMKMYDEKYKYAGEFSISENLYQTSGLEENRTIENINRGTFYQNAANIDEIQDPEISEKFYRHIELASDLPAIDIQRGRDLGIAGYNDYRSICGLPKAKSFDEFLDVMDDEKISELRNLYEDVDDIDLMAGIMSEKFVKDTHVGPTLFCIMVKQMRHLRYTDRFWFERGDQPHSLKLNQLAEIRKTSIARLACDNAEGIYYMQPRGFLSVGPSNEAVLCARIQGADLSKWRDDSCQQQQQSRNNPFL